MVLNNAQGNTQMLFWTWRFLLIWLYTTENKHQSGTIFEVILTFLPFGCFQVLLTPVMWSIRPGLMWKFGVWYLCVNRVISWSSLSPCQDLTRVTSPVLLRLLVSFLIPVAHDFTLYFHLLFSNLGSVTSQSYLCQGKRFRYFEIHRPIY